MGMFHNLAPTDFQFPGFPLPFLTHACTQHANPTKPLKVPKESQNALHSQTPFVWQIPTYPSMPSLNILPLGLASQAVDCWLF